MTAKRTNRPGPTSLFPGKVREPVSLTLTPAHHAKVKKNTKRLGLTRADLIGLLIEKYADRVTTTADDHARLRDAFEALGGTLEYQSWNGPRGGTWLLTLGHQSQSGIPPKIYIELPSIF